MYRDISYIKAFCFVTDLPFLYMQQVWLNTPPVMQKELKAIPKFNWLAAWFEAEDDQIDRYIANPQLFDPC